MSDSKKKIVENAKYQFITAFLHLFTGFLYIFFMARVVTPEEWGLFLLVLSFITFATFICNFVPPAVESTVYYYIPFLKSQNDSNNEIRSFIFHVYKLKLKVALIVSVAYLILIYFTLANSMIFNLCLIMSPSVFFSPLTSLNNSILIANLKFKLLFFLDISTILINNIPLAIIFFFQLQNALIIIAYIHLAFVIINFNISTIFILPLIPKKEKKGNFPGSFKKKFTVLHKSYGFYSLLTGLTSQFALLLRNLLFLNFGVLVYITYLMICTKVQEIPVKYSGSDKTNLISIFSEINYEKNPKIYERLFYQTSRFFIILTCFIIGILFFFMEVYILILYSETYLIILLSVQIFLFLAIPWIISRLILINIYTTNKVKINFKFNIFEMIFLITFTSIGLLYFDFNGLVLLYMLLSLFSSCYLFYLIKKEFVFKPKLTRLLKPVLIFILSLLIVIPFTLFINFFFNSINLINIIINSVINAVLFLICYYFFIYWTRLLTKEDFIRIIENFEFLKRQIGIIQKILNIIIKLLPNEK